MEVSFYLILQNKKQVNKYSISQNFTLVFLLKVSCWLTVDSYSSVKMLLVYDVLPQGKKCYPGHSYWGPRVATESWIMETLSKQIASSLFTHHSLGTFIYYFKHLVLEVSRLLSFTVNIFLSLTMLKNIPCLRKSCHSTRLTMQLWEKLNFGDMGCGEQPQLCLTKMQIKKNSHDQPNSVRNCTYGYSSDSWNSNLRTHMHFLSLLCPPFSQKSSFDQSHAFLQRCCRKPEVQKVSERLGHTSSSRECQFDVWGHFSISVPRKIRFTQCS